MSPLSSNMAQNNGLLVDVDIESPSSTAGAGVTTDVERQNTNKILTLAEGGDEVNSNIFDAIESISSYHKQDESSSEGEKQRQRERINSVDSTNSIRSYDSTGDSNTNGHSIFELSKINIKSRQAGGGEY